MRICVVRHGQTEENLSRILQGHLPGTLTDLGKEQARSLSECIDVNSFDALLTSDLQRVVDTIDLMAHGNIRVPWERSTLFREINWGSLTGRPVDEINFKALPADVETPLDLYNRAGLALEYMKQHYESKNVLVVSHGMFLQSFIAHLSGLSFEELNSVRMLRNCEYRFFYL